MRTRRCVCAHGHLADAFVGTGCGPERFRLCRGEQRVLRRQPPRTRSDAVRRLFGAASLADDLRMASRYGVPDASSLADWPLAHDDLALLAARVANDALARRRFDDAMTAVRADDQTFAQAGVVGGRRASRQADAVPW